MSINDYWNKIQSGDEKALEELFRETFNILVRYAFYLTEDTCIAEEIVQDVFIRIWQKKDNISLKGPIKSYLYRAVHNQAINTLLSLNTQKSKSYTLRTGLSWNEIADTFETEEFIIEKIEAKETEESILKMIESLPQQCREIFILSRFENRSYKEIAYTFKISENTVKTQIYRALSKIKEKLFRKE